MAKKEESIEQKLKELYKLQDIDSELDQIQVLKGELPSEVEDLEDVVAGLDTRINKLQEQEKDMQTEMKNHDANIKEANSLMAKYTKQLDEVKNNREYDALTKELELQKLEVELSEKRKGDLAEKIEEKKGQIAETEGRKSEKAELLKVKKDELSKIIEKTEAQEKKLEKEAVKQRELIEDRFLKAYDKLRKSYRNGLAVVRVERDACGGCFNKIPPQQQLEINMMNKVLTCEHCGRIFVDDTIAGVEEMA